MTTAHLAELNSGIWISWLLVTTARISQAACNSEARVRVDTQVSGNLWPYIYSPELSPILCLSANATWGISFVCGSGTFLYVALGISSRHINRQTAIFQIYLIFGSYFDFKQNLV
jgi:hypothetical protein